MEIRKNPSRVSVLFMLFALTSNSFAGLDPKIRKPAKSAVPKVVARDRAGGYSARQAVHGRRGTDHELSTGSGRMGYNHSQSKTATFGIVTSLQGKSFCIHQNGKLVVPVKTGDGVLKNDLYWVEAGALMQASTVQGGRIAISGPAAVGFHEPSQVKVYHGALRLKSAVDQPVFFSSVFLNAEVQAGSDAAFWVSKNKTQAITLSGNSKTWHPNLKSDQVSLPASYFTEHGLDVEKKYLQPRFPELVEEDTLAEFIERFDESNPGIQIEKSFITRGIASIVKKVFTGTRKKAELVETNSRQTYEQRLRAHIAGKQWPVQDEVAESAPLVSRAPRSPASVQSEVRAMNPQTEALIRKFVSGKF